MGIEEFFSAIREQCSSSEEYAAELLRARGFLLEDDELVISDNARLPDDEEYLDRILRERNLGETRERKIILSPGANMEELFFVDNRIGLISSCGWHEHWRRFVHDKMPPKVPVSWLEPFVARYAKAISACGVKTYLTCDGNHPEKRPPHKIIVECEGQPGEVWHKMLCGICLSAGFKLGWDAGCKEIRIREKDKWSTYAELNRAAAFLYRNREALRNVRWGASEAISPSMTRRLSDEELVKIFSDKANSILEKLSLRAAFDR